jgi:hypothetical protein
LPKCIEAHQIAQARVERRLAAILAADVAGYSAATSLATASMSLLGQLSTHTAARLPGRGAVEEMAGAAASRRSAFLWTRLNAILKRHPLPPARIVLRLYATASKPPP